MVASWSGHPPDDTFEERSLNASDLTTLDLAEIISAQVDERHLSEDQVYTFIAIGGAATQKQANLFKRVRILVQHLGETERFKLLSSGVVGDPSEIAPFRDEFDSVGFIAKYCGAIEAWCAEHQD